MTWTTTQDRCASAVDRNQHGTLIVTGSRVSLGSVIHASWEDETPETICQAYPSLSLGRVYGTIAGCLANRDEVDVQPAAQAAEATRLRESARARSADLRARLVSARRSRSREPGLGRVGRSWQRAGRMAPLRWGARDPHGAASGEDGIRQVRDAFRNRRRAR